MNVKAFFLSHKKLHIWLLADLVLLFLFPLVRRRRSWMNALNDRFTGPLRRALGRLSYRTEVSVMEFLGGLLILAAAE